jgi:hypothetical protein
MMDRIGSAPSVDMMGKLSVRVLDSVRPPCSRRNSELILAPTSIPDNPIPSMPSLDQFPVCTVFTSFLTHSLFPPLLPLLPLLPHPLVPLTSAISSELIVEQQTNQSYQPTLHP